MSNSELIGWIKSHSFQLLGVLLIAPWLLVPRPFPTPKTELPTATTKVASSKSDNRVRVRAARDSSVDAKVDAQADGEHQWRKTTRGWERKRAFEWQPPQAYPTQLHQLHPAALASLQVLLCLGALVAFAPLNARSTKPEHPPIRRARRRAGVRPERRRRARPTNSSFSCTDSLGLAH